MVETVTYLDNNATTPLDPRVAEKFSQFCQEYWANPSSLHSKGQHAQQAILESREQIASCLGATRDEIFFTSGGTESSNLFLQSVFATLPSHKKKILYSPTEHPAVLNVMESFAKKGALVEMIPVDSTGRIVLHQFFQKLTPNVGLVAVMIANNETGILQPIQEIGRKCREEGVLFFADAVQAIGKIPVSAKKLGVHGMSFSAHKFYGPKGVGGLYVDSTLKLSPLQFGGHQERGIRPGTENVPGILAMSLAMKYACEEQNEAHQRFKNHKEKLVQELSKIPGIHINGGLEHTLPNTLNVAIEGVNGESLIVNLDLKNVAVSTGSACSSGATEPSHVLTAMGLSRELSKSSIRISMGKQNTEADIDRFLQILPACIYRLREVAI